MHNKIITLILALSILMATSCSQPEHTPICYEIIHEGIITHVVDVDDKSYAGEYMVTFKDGNIYNILLGKTLHICLGDYYYLFHRDNFSDHITVRQLGKTKPLVCE